MASKSSKPLPPMRVQTAAMAGTGALRWYRPWPRRVSRRARARPAEEPTGWKPQALQQVPGKRELVAVGEDEEARVVDDPVEAADTLARGPADPWVAGHDVEGGAGEEEECDGLVGLDGADDDAGEEVVFRG